MANEIPMINIGGTDYPFEDSLAQARITDVKMELDEATEITKNLWINPVYDADGITLTPNDDGSIHVEGTTTEQLYIDRYLDTPIQLSDFVFSCSKKGTNTADVFVALRNADNTNPKFVTLSPSATSGQFIGTNYAPKRFEIILNANGTFDCDLYVQLEEGTKRTEWIRHLSAEDVVARKGIDDLQETNVLLSKADNYKTIFEIDEYSSVEKWGRGLGVLEHTGKTVHYSLDVADNGGFFTEYFSTDSFVQQNTLLEFDLVKTTGDVRIWLYGKAKGSESDFALVINYPTAGHNKLPIDFAYHDVYTNLDTSKPIRFLITNGGTQTSDFTVSNLKFKSLVTSQGYVNEYEDAQLYQALDRIIASIPPVQENVYLSSPDGNKWILNVSNSGDLNAVRVVPHKSAFIGNSLLMGWSTFGMAASDDEHDYYYHVTSKIHEIDSTATYTHLSNGNLEHSTNSTDFNAAFDVIKPYLTSDLDLICIQLGDNVNTAGKEAQFEGNGGSFDTMVGWIREHCPNTRLVWVGTWYTSIHDWLVTACKANNVEFVDILPLSTSENKAKLGDLIHRTEDRTQTLTGGYTGSGSALNISVVIYGTTYNITIPSYTSVTDNGNGTFTMVAPYTVVDSTGVQSHPGDSGMLAIANAILTKLGIQ